MSIKLNQARSLLKKTLAGHVVVADSKCQNLTYTDVDMSNLLADRSFLETCSWQPDESNQKVHYSLYF